MDSSTELIQNFVRAMNARGLEPLFERDVPQELRVKPHPDFRGMFEWQIRAAVDNPWVSEIESRLQLPFPKAYRTLITHFRFCEFEVGPVMFFANTGAQSVSHDLSNALFADENLYPVLLKNGFVQFGKQAGGGYDPVCFDTKRRRGTDAPIVQLDHEAILTQNRIRVMNEIAPSF